MQQPIIATELTAENLSRLSRREIGLILVRNFYPSERVARREVVDKIINHPKLGNYSKKYTSSVGRVCTPHIDAEWSEEAAARYHAEAIANVQQLRSLFFPFVSPIDYVRLLLQELWPAGANLQQLHGRSCFVGAFRVFNPETSTFYPHHDRIDEESNAPEIKDVVEQLVANVYLETPEQGGDLELWLREPDDQERARIRDVEGLMRESVEPPAITIHPNAGDLTIFSTRMLHAVTRGKGKHRVGMAAFIGCHGAHKPLTFWS
jgi:hypothetical protein